MADGDAPSFQTTRESVESNTELRWGGNGGKAWSEAIDTSTGVTVTDSGAIQSGNGIPESTLTQYLVAWYRFEDDNYTKP